MPWHKTLNISAQVQILKLKTYVKPHRVPRESHTWYKMQGADHYAIIRSTNKPFFSDSYKYINQEHVTMFLVVFCFSPTVTFI